MHTDRPEIAVPEKASKRGTILIGELRSKDIRIPGMLAQLSPISPHSNKAKIYFYPNLDQAKRLLEEGSPFSFEGSIKLDGRVESRLWSDGIWLNNGGRIPYREMLCFTHCSGRLEDLHIETSSPGLPQEPDTGTAWFAASGCYLLQLLATPARDEWYGAKREAIEIPPHRFKLSDGAVAEITRITARHKRKGETEIRKRAYGIQVESVKSPETVKRDVSGLLLLASFASRERCDFGHWSVRDAGGTNTQNWRFGYSKWPKRTKSEEPLLRGVIGGADFLSGALRRYTAAPDTSCFDSAILALLARDLPLETDIVNLYTGVQRALIFALSLPPSTELPVGKLYAEFKKKYAIDIGDLWPLSGSKGDASLKNIRNTLVHGRVFTAVSDFKKLGVAAENLRWILERIVLSTLCWDIELSSVSPKNLNRYADYNWRESLKSLKI